MTRLPSPHLSAIARSSEVVDEAMVDGVAEAEVEVEVGAVVQVTVEELTLMVVSAGQRPDDY